MAEKEYIEREALKEIFERYLNAPHVQIRSTAAEGMRLAIKSCIELLDNKTAADVAPVVHGEWRWEGKFKACSKCGTYVEWTETLGASFWNYCPYCGAKMDGGKANE